MGGSKNKSTTAISSSKTKSNRSQDKKSKKSTYSTKSRKRTAAERDQDFGEVPKQYKPSKKVKSDHGTRDDAKEEKSDKRKKERKYRKKLEQSTRNVMASSTQ